MAISIRTEMRCAMMTTSLVSHGPGYFEDACAQDVVRPMQKNGIFRPVLRSSRVKIFMKGAAKHMVQTIQKNVMVTPEQWKRLGKEAAKLEKSPNQ